MYGRHLSVLDNSLELPESWWLLRCWSNLSRRLSLEEMSSWRHEESDFQGLIRRCTVQLELILKNSPSGMHQSETKFFVISVASQHEIHRRDDLAFSCPQI